MGRVEGESGADESGEEPCGIKALLPPETCREGPASGWEEPDATGCGDVGAPKSELLTDQQYEPLGVKGGVAEPLDIRYASGGWDCD